jgi:hypothetical protein
MDEARRWSRSGSRSRGDTTEPLELEEGGEAGVGGVARELRLVLEGPPPSRRGDSAPGAAEAAAEGENDGETPARRAPRALCFRAVVGPAPPPEEGPKCGEAPRLPPAAAAADCCERGRCCDEGRCCERGLCAAVVDEDDEEGPTRSEASSASICRRSARSSSDSPSATGSTCLGGGAGGPVPAPELLSGFWASESGETSLLDCGCPSAAEVAASAPGVVVDAVVLCLVFHLRGSMVLPVLSSCMARERMLRLEVRCTCE